MSKLVKPHGSDSLKPLLLEGAARKAELERAKTLTKIKLSSREMGDVIMLGIGGFTPLTGFMTEDATLTVLDTMRLPSDVPWTIPIVLDVDENTSIKPNDQVVLTLNSTGIALIVELLAQARKSRKHLIVYGLSEHYLEVFQITRLSDFMDIYEDEANAKTGVLSA